MKHLRERLLDAARDEAPPDSSLERAMKLVESAPAPRATLHWMMWALPAAAVIVGVVLVAVLRQGAESDAGLASPEPRTSSTSPSAPATTSAPKVAMPTPTAPASASAPPSGRIAVRPAPAAPNPAPGAKPAPKPAGGNAGACGCARDDLMCAMRCSQKGKKKK